MRVIAGTAKGVRLQTLEGEATRPTTERVKEALMSAVQFDIEGRRVLDLFAGSGQLGVEALSRGAASCVFVDRSAEAAAVVRKNLQAAGLFTQSQVLCLDSLSYLTRPKERFDLVFLDPPYRISTDPACKAMAEAGILMDGALVVIEHDVRVTPAPEKCYELIDKRQYRDTVISFYQFNLNDTEEEHGGTVGISGQL